MTTPDPRIPTPPEPTILERGSGASLIYPTPPPTPEPPK